MGNILSVYIEDEGIRVCEAAKNGGTVIVKNAFEVPMPSGVVEDGMIMDVEEAAQTLYAAFKNNNIKRGKIAFVISSRKIANKEIVIPYVKSDSKIEEIIKANIDEYFPMNNLEDYVFRHTVLDTFENAEGKHNSVLVMAVQKQMLEGYYQVAETMKMPVLTVDYYSNSVYQLLKRQLSQGTVLALQMDRNVTYVSIMKGKSQLFKRSIPYGRTSIVRNLAELKGVTEEEALGILSDPSKLDAALTPEEYGLIIREFSASVTRVAEFHTSRNPGTVIELARLMGDGVGLIGFADILGKQLGVEVIPLKELVGIKIHKNNSSGLNFEKLVDYLPNIGTLLKSLDFRIEEEKKSSGSYTIFYVLLIVSAVAVAAASGASLYLYEKQKKMKNSLEAEIEDLSASEATYLDYIANQQDYDLIKNYYDSTVNNSEALYPFILDLEQVMPKSVGINTFTLVNGEITMTCEADGKEPVADFVIELKKLPYVSNVKVKNITDVYDEFGQAASTFNLTFNIRIMDTEDNEAEGGIQE